MTKPHETADWIIQNAKGRLSPYEVANKIIQSEKEAKQQVWLIPSENIPSPFTLLSLATSSVNRYLFKHDYNGVRLCPGTEIYQELYDYCVGQLKNLFKSEYISLRPISGMTGMTMVMTTFTEVNDTIFALSPEVGGHTHTLKIATALGRKVHYIPMVSSNCTYYIDHNALKRDLENIKPKLLYLDPMSYPYQFELDRIRKITPKDCALHYDTSHVMSFVAGGTYQNALEYGFDSIGGSTHKTIPSVQKGFFATNDKSCFDKFEGLSGQIVSSLHTSSILALAVTLSETMDFYKEYAEKTLANALFCCDRLEEAGFNIYGPHGKKTDCHVVFLGVKHHCDALEAAHLLSKANIITHPTTLPLPDPEKGLRLGLQELTVLGMGEPEIETIVNIFRKVLIEKEEPEKFADIISDLRTKFKHPSFSHTDEMQLNELIGVLFQ